MFVQCEQSKTYRRFCQGVYGRDLCQANMVDEEQLQKLVSLADLKPFENVLDLGCGGGFTSEYISDLTNARLLGLDFAKGAIEAASARTHSKFPRINFQVGDLNKLPKFAEKFDCIIAIDSLYFVNDLEKTLSSIASYLNPNGRLLIFYSSKLGTNGDVQLETALTNAGLLFQKRDFTANDKEIWTRTKSVALSLKEDFRAEGNSEIYKSRIAEAERNLQWHDEGVMGRWLYYCTFKS
ncbi:MAG: class I SAM-dependent methyltransferase [Bdellovibrio sp.]|nr:class I SAM-dependent methyltransferase [Bdellovibrio sp.]